MDNQQEFNQQEYNKEMEKQLLAHGFEKSSAEGICRFALDRNEGAVIVKTYAKYEPMRLVIYDKNYNTLSKTDYNHSFEKIKEYASYYLGIDLVKKEEQEPLKCTLENAWKGRDRAYWISDRGEIVGRGLEQSAPPDSADFISKQDAEKALLIPRLYNLIRFANEKFPAVEGQTWEYYNPWFDVVGNVDYYGTDDVETQYAFASKEAFRFFIAELENVELLKKLLAPNL